MEKISDLKQIVIKTLDINKAQDIVSIDLKDKSSMADYMIIASGTSSRHIQSLSEQVLEKLKDNGVRDSKIEGKDSNEWKLVDGIDLIIHIFMHSYMLEFLQKCHSKTNSKTTIQFLFPSTKIPCSSGNIRHRTD